MRVGISRSQHQPRTLAERTTSAEEVFGWYGTHGSRSLLVLLRQIYISLLMFRGSLGALRLIRFRITQCHTKWRSNGIVYIRMAFMASSDAIIGPQRTLARHTLIIMARLCCGLPAFADMPAHSISSNSSIPATSSPASSRRQSHANFCRNSAIVRPSRSARHSFEARTFA